MPTVEYGRTKSDGVYCLVRENGVVVSYEEFERYEFYRLPDQVKQALNIKEEDDEN